MSPSPSKFRHSSTQERQWETILDLLSHLLDPKTLAVASSVSKSWNSIISADHHWKPLTLSHFPSVANRHPAIPHRRIFSLLSSARHRCSRPRIPRITLKDLIFAVDVFDSKTGNHVISVGKSGDELVRVARDGVFRFEVDVERTALERDVGEMRVVWNVVMEGWRGAFLMMDRVGKGPWFLEELPGPAYCMKASPAGGVVAELGLGLDGDGDGEGGRMVERVSLGLMMGAGEWRFMSVEDGLLYLQRFLLPSSVQ